MLLTNRLALALEGRREAFQQAAAESGRLRALYLRSLEELAGPPAAAIEDRLGDEPWPGARPTQELDERGLFVPFSERWETAQEARAWAVERLRGIPTVAVDGSQIAPSREFGVPISLVQVAWFENYHDEARPYVKDVVDEVVMSSEDEEIEGFLFTESKVNQRRFVLEMEVAVDRIRGLEAEPPPLVFVDGSFVLSFVGRMSPQARPPYLESLFSLLQTSRERRIPTVGYVDLSMASDLVTMLKKLFGLPSGSVFDAQVLLDRMEAFDRTAAFQCARGDVLPHYRTEERDHSRDLCFFYLKMGSERLPARIDFPRWMLEAGLLDHVADIIRAEAVVGSGYPYALETADAAAVLTREDRMTFYRLFHEFARTAELDVSLPGKSISKAHRR